MGEILKKRTTTKSKNVSVNNWDKNFVKELEQRSVDFRSDTSKIYTWEATKQAAIESVAAKRK